MAKKKDEEVKKSKTTFRERNQKAAEAHDKPKRIRKVAASAARPVGKVRAALKTEYHIIPQKENAGFFSKSRRATPSYFVKAWQELKLVTWPGRKETWKLVFAVYVFAIGLGLAIALLDYGLDKLFRDVIL
jgi:preprotein translocase SecE subunit